MCEFDSQIFKGIKTIWREIVKTKLASVDNPEVETKRPYMRISVP